MGSHCFKSERGEERSAQKGDRVIYTSRLYLNKGDEVPLNAKQVEHLPKDMIGVEGDVTFVERITVLGSRQVIVGIEHALLGMKVGGYRKVRISPHLASRDKGIPDLIPPNAVLIVELWVQKIIHCQTLG